MRELTEREKEFAKIMHDLGKIGEMINSGKDEVIIKTNSRKLIENQMIIWP